MKEFILNELDLICQRIADSSVAAELTGESDKRDNAIRNKARKAFVEDVRAIVQDPKQGGSPILALIRQDALPSSVQKKPSLFAKAILLNQAKVLAAHVFNLAMDGNTGDALRSLTQLAWRGGAWATFSSEASRNSRGGKATGGLHGKPNEKNRRLEAYHRHREFSRSKGGALIDAATEIYRADNPQVGDDDIGKDVHQKAIRKLADLIRKNIRESKKDRK